MYWLLDWEKLDTGFAKLMVDHANSSFKHTLHNPNILYHEGERYWEPILVYSKIPSDMSVYEIQIQIPVHSVYRRSLSFYPPGWHIYKFECDISRIAELDSYKNNALLFVVGGPTTTEEIDWTVLDWSSTPIHRLNEALELDLSSAAPDVVRDYVLFFCSFLCGPSDPGGPLPPFLLPQSAGDMGWEDALPDLTEEVKRGLKIPRMDEPDPPPDPFDLPTEALDARKFPVQGAPNLPDTSTERKRKTIEVAFADFGLNPITTSEESPTSSSNLTEPAWATKFRALLWYTNTMFEANLLVESNGKIQMTDDHPIEVTLPLATWEVAIMPRTGFRILCQQKQRNKIDCETFQTWIDRKEADDTAAPPLRGLRVTGEGEILLSRHYMSHLRFQNVEFVGPVILDGAVFEQSVEFRNCRLLQYLSMRNATIKGSLILDGTRIEGAYFDANPGGASGGIGARPTPPALALDGLRAERSILADRLLVRGRIRGRSLRVDGPLRLRGLRVSLRAENIDGDTAIDLAFANVRGPVDMRSHRPSEVSLGGRTRTLIKGIVSLKGVEAAEVNLLGAQIESALDLQSTRLPAGLDLRPLKLGRAGDPDGASWRTRIGGYLQLDHAKTGPLWLSGSQIAGDLHLGGIELAGSLFCMRDRDNPRFRTRIGGTLLISGAQIRGSIELQGVEIGAEIHFITGSCGRIAAGGDFWCNNESVSFVGLRASGIFLADLSVASSIRLTGVELHGRNSIYTKGGIMTRNVILGGALGFWDSRQDQDFHNIIIAQGTLKPEAVDEVIRSVRAEISGDLDLRGLRTGGNVDLRRSNVNGKIHLDNTRINGRLEASSFGLEASCICSGLTARNAHVDGDANFCGLRVRENGIEAADIEVGGALQFADQKDTAAAYIGKVRGPIGLQGAQASHLIISSDNLDSDELVKDTPAISLARGRFGQLSVRGFTNRGRRCSFPRYIELAPVEVGDWDIKPEREALPLLKAMSPSDRRLYVEIEGRLARIGFKRVADKVYRAMIWDHVRRRRFWLFRPTTWARTLHWLFSGNGTKPWIMFAWLAFLLALVAIMLSEPKNLEPTDAAKPYEINENSWNNLKALALAGSYAIPLQAGARSVPVRARLVGPTCLPKWWPPIFSNPQESGCSPLIALDFSPYDIAQFFSLIQFGLWVFIAANLPAIIRRRNS